MRRVLGAAVSETEVTAAAREMFASYGRYWADVFWFRPRRKEQVAELSYITGLEPVFEAKSAGRGIIFALPHMGNWEAAGTVAEAIEVPVLAVAEDLSNPRITDWFVETRKAYGIDIVIAGRGSVTAQLVRRLREGGGVALVADRDVTGRGLQVSFFGEETSLPAGPVVLADRTGAALFPVGSYFNDGAGYRLIVHEEIPVPDIDDREERLREGTRRFAAKLEEIIERAPPQWHLFQANWPSDKKWAEDRG